MASQSQSDTQSTSSMNNLPFIGCLQIAPNPDFWSNFQLYNPQQQPQQQTQFMQWAMAATHPLQQAHAQQQALPALPPNCQYAIVAVTMPPQSMQTPQPEEPSTAQPAILPAPIVQISNYPQPSISISNITSVQQQPDIQPPPPPPLSAADESQPRNSADDSQPLNSAPPKRHLNPFDLLARLLSQPEPSPDNSSDQQCSPVATQAAKPPPPSTPKHTKDFRSRLRAFEGAIAVAEKETVAKAAADDATVDDVLQELEKAIADAEKKRSHGADMQQWDRADILDFSFNRSAASSISQLSEKTPPDPSSKRRRPGTKTNFPIADDVAPKRQRQQKKRKRKGAVAVDDPPAVTSIRPLRTANDRPPMAFIAPMPNRFNLLASSLSSLDLQAKETKHGSNNWGKSQNQCRRRSGLISDGNKVQPVQANKTLGPSARGNKAGDDFVAAISGFIEAAHGRCKRFESDEGIVTSFIKQHKQHPEKLKPGLTSRNDSRR